MRHISLVDNLGILAIFALIKTNYLDDEKTALTISQFHKLPSGSTNRNTVPFLLKNLSQVL